MRAGAGALAALLVSCSGSPAPEVDWIRELDGLTTARPSLRPGAVSGMISSYDRMGGNRDWADLQACRIGDDRYRLADLKGPGCLRRIWMTNVNAAEWLFYFDGESKPRLRLAERDLFAMGGGPGRFPFVSPLADAISGGSYCYVPLPYRESLQIDVRIPRPDPYARPYFQFNYETYPPATRVRSFSDEPTAEAQAAVNRVRAAWAGAEEALREVAARLAWKAGLLEPGGSRVETLAGAGTLQTLAVRLGDRRDWDPVSRDRVLRHLVLRLYWDGAAEPSVEAPLGDFFCNGLHERRFAAIPMGNLDGALICRFPMPFRNGCRLEIRNDGPRPVPLDVAIERLPDAAPDAGYFHAAFRQADQPGQPLRFLRASGRGAFLGCYLIAHGMDGGWNMLEGDERFFRDGSTRPVHHGTGLEDYFNGGWYYSGLVERPFHGLLEKAAMQTAQYRFQVPDPVTFETGLQMQMEFGDANRAAGYMSAVSYWLQDRPGPAGSEIPPVDRRFPLRHPVTAAASMSALFELERAGLDREAEARSAYYAALFGDQPIGPLFALRALAYREIREGVDAVRDAYRAILEQPGVLPEVAAQARLLMWRGEAPRRALFGGCGTAVFRLFVDGRPVGEGGGAPAVFQAFPVELEPGPCRLSAEVVSRGDGSWYALGFFSGFTNVVSDGSWDYSLARPDGWPSGDGAPSLWKPVNAALWCFPSMQWWAFQPNAFPGVQSGQQVGGPTAGWERPAGRTIYLRRRMEVPKDDRRATPFRRRKELRMPPIRPAGDRSNEEPSRPSAVGG